jgi:hypothetical protein
MGLTSCRLITIVGKAITPAKRCAIEELNQPYAGVVTDPSPLPEPAAAIDPNTAWIWLIAAVPGVDLLLSPFVPGAASLALILVEVVAYIVFAVLDRRELLRRGVRDPFRSSWAILSGIIYVIGRAVVVRRRIGRGLAPMWVFLALVVLSLIATLVAL